MTRTETVIIGAGQAGLSLSRYLASGRRPHVVLDRGRIGERWRSERWDSLTLLTPNWLNRLDGAPAHADPDGFLDKDGFVEYLVRYAAHAPVREHVDVRSVARQRDGFRVETDRGTWQAENVVVATGDSAEPKVPALASTIRDVHQIHSTRYRNPAAVPPGGVLVVGAGPTGQQLAAELRRAGRRVVLAVGSHGRNMRRYRGRDIWFWLNAMGDLEQTADAVAPQARRPRSLTVTGANGGEHLDLAVLDALGVTLAGRLQRFEGTCAHFAGDLHANVTEADCRMTRLLDRIDAHVGEWPEPPDRVAPVRVGRGPMTLDLAAEGITTVLWASGYRRLYPWLDVDALDDAGELVQRYGITPVPGLFVLGRNFQHRRSSHFIGGVGRDAAFVGGQIATRRSGLVVWEALPGYR
jgi:putative flavoprotein involved in K+ transport